MLAIYLQRRSLRPASQVAAGLALYLAYMAKQPALLVALPLVATVIFRQRQRGLWFAGALLLPLLASHLIFDRLSDGWFSYYTFIIPQAHEFVQCMYLAYWFGDMLPVFAPMLILSAFFIVHEITRGERARGVSYLALWVGALLACWVSRLHGGGYVNVLLPVHAALALLAGMGAGVARDSWPHRSQVGRRGIVYALVLAQFIALIYSPSIYVPKERDAQAGRSFVRALAAMPGDVFLPCHGYLYTLAGKRTFPHWAAIYDVLKRRHLPARAPSARPSPVAGYTSFWRGCTETGKFLPPISRHTTIGSTSPIATIGTTSGPPRAGASAPIASGCPSRRSPAGRHQVLRKGTSFGSVTASSFPPPPKTGILPCGNCRSFGG